MKLLLVNDELLTAQTMKDNILWSNYGINEVYVAESAMEAKKILNEADIDVALLDIEMPGENGIELLRWICTEEKNVESIFLTCHADFDYAKEALKLGCRDYILMPALDEEIGEAIQRAVHRHREDHHEAMLKEYGQQWLHAQEESGEIQGNKSPEEIVQKCKDFIMKNIGNEELSVSLIGEHCFLTAGHLNKVFRKVERISIMRFIINQRMGVAKHLLTNTTLPAAEVAVRVGYPSYPHFSTTFRKYFGLSPSQYKEGT